jgi:hypothetical protein
MKGHASPMQIEYNSRRSCSHTVVVHIMHLFLFHLRYILGLVQNTTAPRRNQVAAILFLCFLKFTKPNSAGISPLSLAVNLTKSRLRFVICPCGVSSRISFYHQLRCLGLCKGHTISGTAYVHLGGRDGIPSNPYIGFTPTPSFADSCILVELISGFLSVSMSTTEVVWRLMRSCKVVGRVGSSTSYVLSSLMTTC